MALSQHSKDRLASALCSQDAANDIIGYLEEIQGVTGGTLSPGQALILDSNGQINEFGVDDDGILTLGTTEDIALVLRSTTLAANTALTGVLIGTPAAAATPANSLIVSNVTADGDIVLAAVPAAGANSIEGFRYDASAGLQVFNEAAADLDFRVEGDNNANMFVIDAGTDSLSFGAAVTAGAFLSIDGSAVNRAGVTSVGRGEHMPAATFTQTNADPTTLAVAARVFIGIPTFAGSNANQTLTDAAALWINGAAAAGTNVTITNAWALYVSGTSHFAGRLTTDDGVSSGTKRVVGGRAYSAISATDNLLASAGAGAHVDHAQTYSIPASTLKANSVTKIRAMVRVTDASGTDTLECKLYIGGTTLLTSTAFDPDAAGDFVLLEFDLVTRAAPGASVEHVGFGRWTTLDGSTLARAEVILAPTNLATNGALVIKVSSKWSSTTASTNARLELLNVEIH